MADTDPTGFWAIAATRPVAARAGRVALIVGTILGVINHGDRLIMGPWEAEMFAKIILTYLVPYSVSSYSSVQTIRDRARQDAGKTGRT